MFKNNIGVFMLIFIISFLVVNHGFSRGYDKSINLKAYGGLGFISPSDINAKLNDEDNGLASFLNQDATFDSISSAYNFGAILSYQFNYRFNIGLIFDYLYASSISSYSSNDSFTVPVNSSSSSIKNYEFNQGISAMSAGLLASYCFYSQKRILIDIVGGVLYSFNIKYYEDIYYGTSSLDNSVTSDASASSLGFLLGLNLSYLLSRNLSLTFDLNYKILNASSLKGADGFEYPFTYPNGQTDNAAPMSLNLNGAYLGFGLRYDFALGSSTYNDNYFSYESRSPSFDKARYKDDLKNANFKTDKNELADLKIEARKKYREAVDKKDLKAQDTYNKLYDIIDKLEKGDWDKLSKSQKADRLDKIKKLLN